MTLRGIHDNGFPLFLAGDSINLCAIWMQRLTMSWLAWETTRSASFVGAIAFLHYAPTLFSGPFFGALSDRVQPRDAARIAQCIFLVLGVIVVTLESLSIREPVLMAGCSLLHGLTTSAYHPIRLSFAPLLAEKSKIASVVKLTSLSLNFTRMLAPALAGWIISRWGVWEAFVVQALLYVPYTTILGSFLAPKLRQPTNLPQNLISEVLDGFRAAYSHQTIRTALFVAATFGLVTRGVLEILPTIADEIFSRGAAGLGVMASCASLGALVGGLLQALLPAPRSDKVPSATIASCLISFLLVSAIGLSTNWYLVVGFVTVLGFFSASTGISLITVINVCTPEAMRGRINSLWLMTLIGSSSLGALIIGFVSTGIGQQVTLITLGGLAMIVLAAGLLMSRKRRTG